MVGSKFNFFQRVSVTQNSFQENYDVGIKFSNYGLILANEGTGVVQVSFDGINVHTELNSADASKFLMFNNRTVATIWFRLKSGSTGPISIRVEAW